MAFIIHDGFPSWQHLAAGEEDVAAALPSAKDHLRLPRQRGRGPALALQRDVDAWAVGKTRVTGAGEPMGAPHPVVETGWNL